MHVFPPQLSLLQATFVELNLKTTHQQRDKNVKRIQKQPSQCFKFIELNEKNDYKQAK